MTEKWNMHGDVFRPAGEGRGVDISHQRQDELDIACLDFIREHVKTGENVSAVDLGGGFGAHSLRMAEAGATVTMVDSGGAFTAHHPAVRLLQKDFREVKADDIPQAFQVLYSQRAIHYIRYAEALELLKRLASPMVPDGRAFISAAGYDTEYGKTYPDRDKPVEQRFARVMPDMAEKHDIRQPIVIYTEGDMKRLLEEAGFRDVRTSVSAFGNIKAMARVS
jgi:cyclopropane fatty-acyl-phospholipid synthase-like methyltransferase